jgi:uncharacterized phiE125 gp8 family phage protein
MRLRSLAVATQPIVEPVSLAMAKGHLSLLPEQEEDDTLIVSMIATARRLIERRLGVALAPQQLRAKFDATDGMGWTRGPDNVGPVVLRLPVVPVLTGGSYPVAMDVDGTAVSSSTYTVDADAGQIRFSSAPKMSDLTTLTVTYWAGQATIVPQLRTAILLYVGHLYANREAVISTGAQPVAIPMAFETLLASESVSGRW